MYVNDVLEKFRKYFPAKEFKFNGVEKDPPTQEGGYPAPIQTERE